MGLGDIFKAATGTVPGLNNALAWAGNQIGEKGMEYANRGRGNPQGHRDTAGVLPAQRVQNVVENASLDVGEKYGENLQQKYEAGRGLYKIGDTIVTNPTQVGKTIKTTGQAVKEDPGLLIDVGKTVATDMTISALMDPTTYMGGGVLLATTAAERTAARAAERAALGVAEETAARTVARSADEIAEELVQRSAQAAPEGLDDALRVTAAGNAARMKTRSGQFLNAIDQAPANLRETITDEPIGSLGRRRIDWGESRMPGPQPTVARSLIKDTLQGSPTMPTEGAGLAFRQSKWRAGQIGRRAAMPGQARSIERVGLIADNPMKALTSPEAQGWAAQGAEWVVKEHPEVAAAVGGVVAANAAVGAYGMYKGLMGGDDEGAAAEKHEQTEYVPTPTGSGLTGSTWARPESFGATRNARQSRRDTGSVTTVYNDTMPREIGPSNWYGPQGGYAAGRGFQSTAQEDIEGI